jgi:hypothetical protein
MIEVNAMTERDEIRFRGPSARRFGRHYVEMVAAMLLGMVTLGMPADWLLRAIGVSASGGHHTTKMLATMAVTMTVPMVAWMRYRGHAWRPIAEMAASMLLPTLAVLVLLWTGVATGAGVLMVIEHAAMLVCMLGAMLARWDEYSGAGHVHGASAAAVVTA